MAFTAIGVNAQTASEYKNVQLTNFEIDGSSKFPADKLSVIMSEIVEELKR